MSDANGGSGAAVGAPTAARPATANDGAAVPMPEVPAGTKRGSLSDFVKNRREGTLAPRAPQQAPKSTREHIADFSKAIEAKQDPGRHVLDQEQAGTQFDVPPDQRPTPEKAPKQQPEAPAGDEPQTAPTPEEEGHTQPEETQALSDQEILAKYREWEQSDLFPEELASKMHEVKVRGQTRYVDTNELRQGYMRHSDYTQRGNELKQREQTFAQQEGFYKEHFEAIRDPANMLEIYERNGYGEQLEKVAEMIAERRVEHRSLVRAAGHAAALKAGFTHEQIAMGHADNHRTVVEAMQRADQRLKQARAVEIENRKLSAETERTRAAVQEQRHKAEVQKHLETYNRQLNQLRPGAFRAHGIEATPQNEAAFKRHLSQVIQLNGGLGPDGITRAHVMAAAQNLREEREDTLAAEGGLNQSAAEERARRQAEARRALGPTRTGTGSGQPMQRQQAQQRRASDFGKQRWNGTLGK